MIQLIKHKLILTDEVGNCWHTFLNALKIQFDNFAMYKAQEFYFKPGDTTEDIQEWVNNYSCVIGEELIFENSSATDASVIVKLREPTIHENLEKDLLWINKRSGEMFVCVDNTTDANIWKGTTTGKIIQPIPPADKFDFLGDNSTVAFYKLNGDASDVGGQYHGKDNKIEWVTGIDGNKAASTKSGQILIKKLPFSASTEEVTISTWLKWNGNNGVMPFGFNKYDIFCYRGNLGFNTFAGDVHGADFKDYKHKWIYFTAVFKKGVIGDIYFDKEKKILTDIGPFIAGSAVFDNKFSIFGCTSSNGYRNFGTLSRLRIFNRALTESEVYSLATSEMNYISSIKGGI